MMSAMASAEDFQAHRPLLISIAYRMLGSMAEAEDIVQDAWLRWQAPPDQPVESPRAWLSTVVTRLCLDQLKSARVQRESYVGPWLPEPTRTDQPPVRDAESISMAFLLLLESLSPVERAVYLLHEVFDYSHAEVAVIVGKEESACRQMLHRAREHLRERRPRFAASPEAHQRLLGTFLQAVTAGDLDGLRTMLAADATAWSDGGGRVRAALKPVLGADAVARFLIGVGKKTPPGPGTIIELTNVNGWPALITRVGATANMMLTIETDGDKVFGVHIILNPDKLARL